MFYLDILKVDLGVAVLQWLHTLVSSTYFKCFIYFGLYVVSVSFGCLKSRSGVVGDRPPTAAAEAPPWFTCQRLRPADAFAVRISRRGKWARVVVPPCGCGSRFCCADTGWAWFHHARRGMGAGHNFTRWRWWKWDGVCGIRCMHETRELRLDAGLAILTLPQSHVLLCSF
jgi:hypothetical protein